MSKALRHTYLTGTEIQYRNGQFSVKSEEFGLIAKSRYVAQMSDKVINGGEELKKGWRVCHLDMSTFGQKNHNDPRNLVVIKCRTTKFEFLKASRIVFEPKREPKNGIATLAAKH